MLTSGEPIASMEPTVLENTQICVYTHRKNAVNNTSATIGPEHYNNSITTTNNIATQPQRHIKRRRQCVAAGRERTMAQHSSGRCNSSISAINRQLKATTSPNRHHHQHQHCRKQDL
ncbi:uncharacterized protein LOC126759573 [Bactrocera neohumeralis]|uniref:uncharacterized protein LOC126759573 n=1 Tax=Bactrocera neohumeralis TaxID=98809 RepID=UPI002166AEB6|nr:uncharacterized protein LOC126759573 [Bactrocera neohumeralis]